jgi:hypothetical protein
MEFDWEGARRKDRARKSGTPVKGIGRKGSAIDVLTRLQSEIRRVDTVNWLVKTDRQKDLALAEIERLRSKLLLLRPGFAGSTVDEKAVAAAAKLMAVPRSVTGGGKNLERGRSSARRSE